MGKKWYEILGICLLFLVLAIVSTYPLIKYFDNGVLLKSTGGHLTWNRSGDQLQLMYWFWLVKENILGLVPFNTNPYEFNMLVSHASTGLTTFPLAFLYILFSPLGKVAAYNCTVVSSYVLTGTFMYLLVLLYSNNRFGALLGALLFTLMPIRISGITGGGMYGYACFLYPLILFFLEKGIRSRSVTYGTAAGLGFIALSMLEPHLLYYMSLFCAHTYQSG